MALKMMQEVLDADKQLNEGRRERGKAAEAALEFKDAVIYVEMLAKGEISPENVTEVADKAYRALLAHGNAHYQAHGWHPNTGPK